MAKFSVRNIKELEGNADQFISSISLAEDSKCSKDLKEIIL